MSVTNSQLENGITHELFHILTRSDSIFKNEMYKIIGFKIINPIEYPVSLRNLIITNPDSPQADSYITVKRDGNAIDCVMILYSKTEYNGGEFFQYLNVGFLKLKDSKTGKIEYYNDQPIIYNYNEITNIFEQVGRNTQYLIQPEEILADNFVFAMNNIKGLPSQWIVDQILKKLKK